MSDIFLSFVFSKSMHRSLNSYFICFGNFLLQGKLLHFSLTLDCLLDDCL